MPASKKLNATRGGILQKKPAFKFSKKFSAVILSHLTPYKKPANEKREKEIIVKEIILIVLISFLLFRSLFNKYNSIPENKRQNEVISSISKKEEKRTSGLMTDIRKKIIPHIPARKT